MTSWIGSLIHPTALRVNQIVHRRILAEELRRRESRIRRLRLARRALEERAREQAQSEGQDENQAQPAPKAQFNFTDPESRIMKGAEGSCRPTTRKWPWSPCCN